MRILGIDPGTARIGYGIIDSAVNNYTAIDYGCITTRAQTPLAIRLTEISDDLDDLISTYSPDVAAVEELFFSKNVNNSGSFFFNLEITGFSFATVVSSIESSQIKLRIHLIL